VHGHHFPLDSLSRARALDFLAAASSAFFSICSVPAVSSGLADVPSVALVESLEGFSWTGMKGGGAEEIGVAAMGWDVDGCGV
jgi:hypothetical protein